MLTVPSNVAIEVASNTATIRFTKGTDAVRTEIDRFWVNGEGTYDDYTTGEAFYYDGLTWGATLSFKLRSFSSTGEIAETDVYSFSIEEGLIPTIATNVQIGIEKNIATITFDKGVGVRTYIDKFWVNGEGTEDDYTTSNGFYLENLPWGLEGQFKLITRSNTGAEVSSDIYSFKIEDEIIPTAPSNVTVTVTKNSAEIRFVKGAGIITRLDEFWVNGQGTFDLYTRTDSAFFLENLEWGKEHQFVLRSEGNSGLVADTEIFTFKTDDEIIPVAPVVTQVVKFKNNAEIHFDKGNAVRTLIDKFWVNGQGTFDDYTYNDGVFYLEGLDWGGHYEYVLRNEGNSGKVADTAVLSFDIDAAIGPVLPTTVNANVDLNTVAIIFSGQEGIRTEIAKSWDGGLDSFVEYTSGQSFYYDNLAWGSHNEFKLRVVSNTGAVLVSDVYSFDIVANPTPIAPTNITQEVGDTYVTVRFTKGNGVKTQIDCSWINGLGTWDDYTTGEAFYFEGLPSNSKLQYKLRTVSVGGEVAESELKTFNTPLV